MTDLFRAWGRVVLGSVPLPGMPKQNEVRTKSILDNIQRQEGWRSDINTAGQSSPPEDVAEAKDWLADRVARTAAGSALVGTTRLRAKSQTDRRFALAIAVPYAASVALEALKSGRPVTIITEGVDFDPKRSSPTKIEGDLLASLVFEAAKTVDGAIVDYQTWDDDPVNVLSPRSPVWARLSESEGGDNLRARACIAIRMLALGMPVEDVREAGILIEDAQALVEALIEQELPKKIPASLRNLFYRTTFPLEFGDAPNEVSAISTLYDALRQSNILRKLYEAERKGSVAVILAPIGFGYSIKPVVGNLKKKRVAVTQAGIEQGLDPALQARAKSVKTTLKKADPDRAIWTYSVSGSKGAEYTVRVKGLPKKGQTKVKGMDILVSCDCDFFRWQGPEHWAKAEGYLYGKPAGNAASPDVKDPNGKNRLCKHVVAVLGRSANWVYTPSKK